MRIKRPALILPLRAWLPLAAVLFALALGGCGPAAQTQAAVLNLLITVDGQQLTAQVPTGTTVQAALEEAGVALNSLDRVEPPGFSVLTEPAAIKVTRVREEFEVREVVVPFEEQRVRNELLPKDEVRRVQEGSPGLTQDTYRHLYEDGVLVSTTLFQSVVVTEARPEIIMVGVQLPVTPTPLAGRLVYLTAGNAWIMEETTGDRRPLVTTGDLDGYIFSLSPDGEWLLYSRKAPENDEGTINTLWAVRVTDEIPAPIDLLVNNVIHFAAWVPGENQMISYSTVEPRSAAPGWQANNDLHTLAILPDGKVGKSKLLVDSNAGGVYGWWGASFAWSPDGSRVAYARPDGVGLVNLEEGTFEPLMEILPLQTGRDWAWVPGLSWSPDGRVLYTINHGVEEGMPNPEESQHFHLTGVPVSGGPAVPVALDSGMFAYPSAARRVLERSYRVAYIKARFPLQSETSNYRLWLMDRDGSNQVVLFPSEDNAGLNPQQVVWSPPAEGGKDMLAVLLEGNLYLVNAATGESQKVTGDGSISRIDWQ